MCLGFLSRGKGPTQFKPFKHQLNGLRLHPSTSRQRWAVLSDFGLRLARTTYALDGSRRDRSTKSVSDHTAPRSGLRPYHHRTHPAHWWSSHSRPCPPPLRRRHPVQDPVLPAACLPPISPLHSWGCCILPSRPQFRCEPHKPHEFGHDDLVPGLFSFQGFLIRHPPWQRPVRAVPSIVSAVSMPARPVLSFARSHASPMRSSRRCDSSRRWCGTHVSGCVRHPSRQQVVAR